MELRKANKHLLSAALATVPVIARDRAVRARDVAESCHDKSPARIRFSGQDRRSGTGLR